MNNPPESKLTLNANTGISIGIVVVLLGGFGVVIKGLSDNRTETTTMKTELSMQALTTTTALTSKIEKIENRMTALEDRKNSWTMADMFKWAVHLQQSNSDPKKLQTDGLKVPEPEPANK